MSSPAAAEAALLARLKGEGEPPTDEEAPLDTLEDSVYDPVEREAVDDAAPTAVVEEASAQVRDLFGAPQKARLKEFAQQACAIKEGALAGGGADAKVERLTEVVQGLLVEGFNPIVWCRYIPTADYVAEVLKARLKPLWPGLQVDSVTGSLPEEARRERVEALGQAERRVLVATDCLSEGINLQDHFQAVVHYDLPWNPNRLEQREGRVDRFGQPEPSVKAVLLYGSDNPVDGAVLEVLLRKARQIRDDLGVSVPVPEESVQVVEAILSSLFQRWREPAQQLRFDQPEFLPEEARRFLRQWEEDAARERHSRSRFAQRALRPEEVQRELEETDAVLGDPEAVQRFLRRALARLDIGLSVDGDLWTVDCSALPTAVRDRMGDRPSPWQFTFRSPLPKELEGIEMVGRNHLFVVALAEHVLTQALEGDGTLAARCSAIVTDRVERLTTLYLLRARYLVHEEGAPAPQLAEEALAWGMVGSPEAGPVSPLAPAAALALLEAAQPVANISPDQRVHRVRRSLEWWGLPEVQGALGQALRERAARVAEAQRRIRRLAGRPPARVEPSLPPDLLGVYVLVPPSGR